MTYLEYVYAPIKYDFKTLYQIILFESKRYYKNDKILRLQLDSS